MKHFITICFFSAFVFVSQVCAQWPVAQFGPGSGWDFVGLTRPSKDSNRVYGVFFIQTTSSENVRYYGVSNPNQPFLLRSITILPNTGIAHKPIGPSLAVFGDSRILVRNFDTNSDGYNELIDQSDNRIRIYDGFNGGSSIYEDDCSSDPNKVKLVDLNNDGKVELIYTRPNNVTVVAFTPAVIPSVYNETEVVDEFKLRQNYPNPFNPSTTIEYELSKNSSVKIVVHNILGQEVRTILNEPQLAGNHKLTFDGSELPSGTYFYTLVLDGVLDSKKMLILK